MSGSKSLKRPSALASSVQTKIFTRTKASAAPHCPVCGRMLWMDAAFNNIHIDKCLAAPAQHSIVSKRIEVIDLVSEIENETTWSTSTPSRPLSEIEPTPCSLPAYSEALPKRARIVSPLQARLPVADPDVALTVAEVRRLADKSGLSLEALAHLPGLFLVHNFITIEEEEAILKSLDSDSVSPWNFSSFNGHCQSKVFGARIQFGLPKEERLVRTNDSTRGEQDVPAYLIPIVARAKALFQVYLKDFPTLPPELRTLQVNECNANSYSRSRGDYLKPHFDDRALAGPLLLNLSLLGECFMSYSLPTHNAESEHEHKVKLPRRCLQIISQAARWSYMHSIRAEDLLCDRRVSVTFRQSGARRTGVVSTAQQQRSKEALQAYLQGP